MQKNFFSISPRLCVSAVSSFFAFLCVLCVSVVNTLHAQPAMRLTLADAEHLAVQNNPQFSSARYTAAASAQVPVELRAANQPNFTGSFTTVGADNGSRLAAGGLNNPVVYDRVGSGLTISQLITDFGRTSNLIGSARLHAEAMNQYTEATRANILLQVGAAYYNLLKAKSVLRVADETVKARQLVVDQVSARLENKLSSTLDVTFAKYNLSDARLLQSQYINDEKAAEAQLANVLAVPTTTTFDLAEEPMPSPLPDKVADLIDTAIQNRPELKDLRLEQSAAQRFVKAEHALNYPSVGVLGTAGFAPAGEAQIPGRYGAVGMNISIPIFNGGLFHARQTEAELKSKAAAENVTDLQNRVVRDVRVAYLNAITAYDRIGLTQELLNQATQSREYAQARYDLGLATMIELSQAELNLTVAQIANTTARYDYQAAHLNVDFQTGILH